MTEEELKQRVHNHAKDLLVSIGRRRDYIKQLNKTIEEITKLRDDIQATLDKYEVNEKFD